MYIEIHFIAVAATERSNRCAEKGASVGDVTTVDSAREVSDTEFSFLLILALVFVCGYTP